MTLSEVRNDVLSMSKRFSKYLYNKRMYGNRLYISDKGNKVCVFVYLRDVIGRDYTFNFYNTKEK